MGRRGAVVLFVACISVVLAAGCSALGIPDISPPATQSGSGEVASPPPSSSMDQSSDGSDGSATPSDDGNQSMDDTQSTRSSSGADSSPPDSSEAPEVVASYFAGCWDSPEWGWMRLEAAGTAVSGSYEHDEGRIEGVVEGSVLSGMWSEDPSYAPPNDAGQIEFVLSEDGQSFTGHWSYGTGDGWSGSWTAQRVECAPVGPSQPNGLWADRWETNFGDMELQFSGDRVTGEYDADNGKIDGVVSGRVMTGTWSESPSYTPPNDAGQFEFTLSEDGLSFDGQWRYGSEGAWHSWWGEIID